MRSVHFAGAKDEFSLKIFPYGWQELRKEGETGCTFDEPHAGHLLGIARCLPGLLSAKVV